MCIRDSPYIDFRPEREIGNDVLFVEGISKTIDGVKVCLLYTSYSKKGDAVVEMNYKAIDAGVDGVHKVEVPESWKNPEADAPKAERTGCLLYTSRCV